MTGNYLDPPAVPRPIPTRPLAALELAGISADSELVAAIATMERTADLAREAVEDVFENRPPSSHPLSAPISAGKTWTAAEQEDAERVLAAGDKPVSAKTLLTAKLSAGDSDRLALAVARVGAAKLAAREFQRLRGSSEYLDAANAAERAARKTLHTVAESAYRIVVAGTLSGDRASAGEELAVSLGVWRSVTRTGDFLTGRPADGRYRGLADEPAFGPRRALVGPGQTYPAGQLGGLCLAVELELAGPKSGRVVDTSDVVMPDLDSYSRSEGDADTRKATRAALAARGSRAVESGTSGRTGGPTGRVRV